MQANDPKHTMEELCIYWWKTPPESPDLNPIENLWHELKSHLRSRVKPRTKETLIESINSFWSSTITPEKCCKYIGHIQHVLQVVVEREGKSSGF